MTKIKNQRKELPEYSGLTRTPNRGLPADLEELECGQTFGLRCQAIREDLLRPNRRPAEDKPLFAGLLAPDEGGVVTITLPDNAGQCVAVFSTPVRAADYVQTLLATGPRVQYLASSPLEVLCMLRDLERAGAESFALDPCPRCGIFSTVGCQSIKTAHDAITIWGIAKATEQARAELYYAYAREAACQGQIEVACSVALEAVGHVTLEDPRFHLLLGQIALARGDRAQFDEASAFLQLLGFERFQRKLEEVARSGIADFADQ
jgi:hypothetical protein